MKKTPIILTDEEKARISEQCGTNLIKLIEEKFEFQQRFVARTDIKERLLFKLRKGGNPTLHTIALLAKALEVHPRELFDFEKREGILLSKDFPGLRAYQAYRKTLEDKNRDL
jgi:hypothetical protein